MLHIKNIKLYQYRNYFQRNIDFVPGLCGLCGPNGSGKTNLLDAIHMLCFTKSYFNRQDVSNVMHGTEGLRVEGVFEKNGGSHNITYVVRENLKKELFLDGEQYKKLSLHIGRFPIVMIAPDDIQLINGGSEERRKYLDGILSQTDSEYLQNLIEYNKVLLQRNAFLKQQAGTGSMNYSLLEIYDVQLAFFGEKLLLKRSQVMEELIAMIMSNYSAIAGKDDLVSLAYKPSVSCGKMEATLSSLHQKDILLQRTSSGPHKDDILIELENKLFKTEASQGQKKSLLFAMKLAEWFFIKKYSDFFPLLLLDDVFEKLDEQRMHLLLTMVGKHQEAQIIITDTHKQRLVDQLSQFSGRFSLIDI